MKKKKIMSALWKLEGRRKSCLMINQTKIKMREIPPCVCAVSKCLHETFPASRNYEIKIAGSQEVSVRTEPLL